MNQLISNVLMQPKADATERPLTLVEKLEQLSNKYFNQYAYHGDNADLNCSSAVDDAIDMVKRHQITLIEKLEQEKNNWYDDGENNVHRIIDDCIDIVKQHQAESEWIAYKDERKPKNKSRVLAFDGRREFIALYDKGFYIVANGEYYGCVTHWMELPLPPHESRGGAYECDLYQVGKEKGKFFKPSEVQDD